MNTPPRNLTYTGNFRAGTITYSEGDLRIDFWHEMGGGSCRFFVHLPTAAEWARATGTPLTRRDDIVAFVAETVCREKADGLAYEIEESQITYYGGLGLRRQPR